MAREKGLNDHWYDGIVDAFRIYIPGNNTYHTMRARNARIGTLFILPFVIGFLVFMISPLMESFTLSISKAEFKSGVGGYEMIPFGFRNYVHAFTVDAEFNTLLLEGIGEMVINTIATLVLSFVVAVILNQEFKGRTLCRAIFFLTVILSSGVLPGIEHQNITFDLMASKAASMEEASGVNISAALQDLLRASGVGLAAFEVVFTMIDSIYDIVMASGIQIIVFLSGLQSISTSLYEAADVEGCSAWESFWKITFPMVSPLLVVNCIYTIVDFFMKNDNKVMELINKYLLQKNDYGVSSAMSWIYFAVAFVFIGISSFIITKAVKSYE